MGRLTVTEFMTLDGVAQAPGAPGEDREGGFTHGGWQAPMADPEAGATIYEQASEMDGLLLGRRTYEIFAGYWPTAPVDSPFTDLLNRIPKYVATRTLAGPLSWQGSACLAGPLRESVTSLKEDLGELHLIGSLDLLQTLLRLELVDRLDLWLYPVLLGSGKRVFAGGTVPAALRLASSDTYPSGTLQLTYERAGLPTYGNLAT